jgi:hypothetical protein
MLHGTVAQRPRVFVGRVASSGEGVFQLQAQEHRAREMINALPVGRTPRSKNPAHGGEVPANSGPHLGCYATQVLRVGGVDGGDLGASDDRPGGKPRAGQIEDLQVPSFFDQRA